MSTVTVEQALAEHPDVVGSRLLALHEDQWFDRKSARIAARDLAPHVVAMGNAEGGTLVVGLYGGEVEGTDRHAARRNDLMQVAVDFTVPPVRMRSRLVPCRNEQGEDDHLLVLDIEPDDDVHATTKDEVFLRIADESRKLSFAQRQELTYDKGQASYEARAVGATAAGARLDPEAIGDYVSATKAANPERLLAARGFVEGDQLTVAGMLLFAHDPQTLFPEAFVRVLRYRGVDRGTGASQQLVVDERCAGPLPRQLLAARPIIAREQPTRRALGPDGRFGPIPLIPEPVWLEALVNAVVHRSYSLAGDHIRVEIFDDRIEVSSPGRLPGLVDFSDPLNVARFARNPRIARVLADLNFGQELGEGVRRMFQEMRDAGLHDPDYRQTSGSVIVTLSTESAHQALDARLSADAKVVVSALRTAGRLSTGELSELLGVSSVTGLKRLRRMQEESVVEWIGKTPHDPRAYWTLPAT
jgi:ATP-dependent DNA helicase RecG